MELKPGYKQTEVGVIPEEWEVKQFTEVTDLITCGIAATPDYVTESCGYPFLSSTNVKEGQILWMGYKHIGESLHRQLYRNNPPQRGDILYSRVGTIGEAAVIDVDFEFSVYVSLTLIKPKKSLDNYFLMQLLNSAPYKKRAKDQVYLGGGVGNLNVDVVRKYPIIRPPLLEQRAIAGALGAVDALIGALDQLIVKKRDIKQAAMQQLLTGQTRLPGFSGEWEVKRLGELLEYEQPTKYLVKDSEYSDENDVPVLTAGKTFVLGYTNEENGIFNNLPVIIFDDFTTANKYVNFPFKAKSSAMKILKPRDATVNLRLVFEAMQLMKFPLGDHKRYWISEYRKLEIKIPKDDEQTAIATVLSDMDAEIAALEARRDKTRALKQGMMQELLTGRTRLV